MSNRLERLRRQRALLQQHLEFLDAEIAAETRAAATPVTPESVAQANVAASHTPSPIESISLRDEDAPEESAEKIAERFGETPEAVTARTKAGCWSAFLIVTALLGAAVALWYWLRSR